MKIVTPLAKHEYYEPLVEAGAGEFYAGYAPLDWITKYRNVLSINIRGVYISATGTFTSKASIRILSKKVQEYKVPVKMTFNFHYYHKEQYPELLDVFKELIDNGFDTFIIGDIALVNYIRENDIPCKIHLSGEAGSMNQHVVKFHERFNISRFIFPRKTTIKDMKACIYNSSSNIEFEAFVLNRLCQFTGAYCNTIHCEEITSACFIPFLGSSRTGEVNTMKDVEYAFKLKNDYKLNQFNNVGTDLKLDTKYQLGGDGCGLCKIKELMGAGVEFFKVVGRGQRAFEFVLNDIRNTSEIIEQAKKFDGDYIEFEKMVKEKYFGNKCPKGLCYYFNS